MAAAQQSERSIAPRTSLTLCAPSGQILSIELHELMHGIFINDLLQGLAGKADYNRDRQIKIKELDGYLSEVTESLSRVLQKLIIYPRWIGQFRAGADSK